MSRALENELGKCGKRYTVSNPKRQRTAALQKLARIPTPIKDSGFNKGTERKKIIYVTGTSTGVGKTVATSLLLCYLRQAGVNAMAVKLFSCGGREDAEKLREIQLSIEPCGKWAKGGKSDKGARGRKGGKDFRSQISDFRVKAKELSLDEVNPFFYEAPLAPLVAQRLEGQRVALGQAVRSLERVLPRCDTLLVEGCGGLLVPLGKGFNFVDVIRSLGGDILVVGPNQLGVINHVLLTLNALGGVSRRRDAGGKMCGSAGGFALPGSVKILLMGQGRPDVSSASNAWILGEVSGCKGVLFLPFLGYNSLLLRNLQECCRKYKKTLAALAG